MYNTEDKLYILKLNGFERFPGKLFTSTIVKSEISCMTRDPSKTASECWCCTLANLLKTLYIERKPDLCTETIETTSQDNELSWETNKLY